MGFARWTSGITPRQVKRQQPDRTVSSCIQRHTQQGPLPAHPPRDAIRVMNSREVRWLGAVAAAAALAAGPL